MNIKLKRTYDAPEANDGYRVLVDRLWPRGIKKENLHADEWAKTIAPTTECRKAFNHDPELIESGQTDSEQLHKRLTNPKISLTLPSSFDLQTNF